MKKIRIITILVLFNATIFAQKEANWWHLGHHIAMNFSSGTPVYSFNSAITTDESCASISDSIGSLQFYTNGDTIWDKNNNIMANGDLYTLQQSSASTTEGTIIVMKPKSLSKYYVFSLGSIWKNYLKYAEVDMNLNAGNGIVTSKNNILISDTLTEKMTATKHCNNIDVWVVVVNWNNVSFSLNNQNNRECSFLSYLVTSNGVNPSPVISKISLVNPIMSIGQMKFNPKGDMIAWSDSHGISLFNFNKETGKVTTRQNIPLPLDNGYGLEFSADGDKIYVNEKQYDLNTHTLTKLLNYACPSQLQIANNKQIYKNHFPKAEILSIGTGNAWYLGSRINNAFRLSTIKLPNVLGAGCTFDTLAIYDYSYNFPYQSLGLPNFPSYYFHHPKGEFAYSGFCVGNTFQFYMKNTPVIADSVKWLFYDNNQSIIGFTASHIYANIGLQQVSCIVYNGGIGDTTTQCVTVCGKGYLTIPRNITLCYGSDTILNTLSPCGQKYKWNTGDTTSTVKINTNGNYIIQTINTCGVYEDTITVDLIYCDPSYEIPNVFTPNNDGINDVYSVKLKNIKNINARFYNRWGNEIQSKEEEVNITMSEKYNLWDGKTLNNNICEDGTYYYIIMMTDFKGNEIKAKGFVTLLSK